MRVAVVCLLVATVSLSACSSISSMQVVEDVKSDGLVYHLPRRDFVVTVTKAEAGVTDITLDVTAPYADLSSTYVLEHNSHVLAKNKLTIEVSAAGLLTSSKATTTIELDAVAKSIGELAGRRRATLVARAQDPKKPDPIPDCSTDGTHVFLIKDTADKIDACRPAEGQKVQASIKPLWTDSPTKISSRTAPGVRDSGLFYRMNRPYVMTATTGTLSKASVVMSPSASQPYFLPVSRSLFTTNDADFTFEAGIPKKYVQETDGELVALLKLPAKVLEEYFNAIGAAFGKSKDNAKAEADALAESLNLEIVKKKVEACLEAIRMKNDTAFKDLKCGE